MESKLLDSVIGAVGILAVECAVGVLIKLLVSISLDSVSLERSNV